ncbi:hypothetical protein BN1232_00736 [Mycobacterium lentiflavum]|uniref:Uncharacterized protein n=1 Tax=Mycobacterium lentiflavum TaxID=141349 RepID=A0A0E4GY44_MYCLN|nr:hypothetical protein BN1232_00736 [Mycobacterium lentiflavum]
MPKTVLIKSGTTGQTLESDVEGEGAQAFVVWWREYCPSAAYR